MASPGASFALIQATLVCSKGLNRVEQPYAYFNAGVLYGITITSFRIQDFLVPMSLKSGETWEMIGPQPEDIPGPEHYARNSSFKPFDSTSTG